MARRGAVARDVAVKRGVARARCVTELFGAVVARFIFLLEFDLVLARGAEFGLAERGRIDFVLRLFWRGVCRETEAFGLNTLRLLAIFFLA